MSVLQTLETNIVNRLTSHVSALQEANGGICKGVADVNEFMANTALPTPAAIVVFDGERANGNISAGGVHQPTSLEWSVFVVASSFSNDHEGRTSAYALIDDVIAALQGYQINTAPIAKMFYTISRRFNLTDSFVIYQVSFRSNHIRSVN